MLFQSVVLDLIVVYIIDGSIEINLRFAVQKPAFRHNCSIELLTCISARIINDFYVCLIISTG